MKLEDALDEAIQNMEDWYRHYGFVPNLKVWEAWEKVLRCADEEWQRRELLKIYDENPNQCEAAKKANLDAWKRKLTIAPR